MFWAGYGTLRSKCPLPKMWVEKNCAEGKARTQFYGTLKPPNGGGTLTVCYAKLPIHIYYNFLKCFFKYFEE
jgi:hypothetical protein